MGAFVAGIKDLTDSVSIGGDFKYNGYSFGPFRSINCKFRPVYDQIGRTVIALDIIFDVHAIIHGSQGGDSSIATTQERMDSLERKLSEPGKKLIVKNCGFALAIDSSVTPDLDYGPKPELIACVPMGGCMAFEVSWTVTYRRPPLCASGGIAAGFIIEGHYQTELATNEEGLVQRVISGEIGFLNVRTGAAISINPETVFDKLKFEKPNFFAHKGTRRKFNAAKNRVEFTRVDEECSDDAWPDGMVAADFEESVENLPPGFVSWSCGLSGTLTTAPGIRKSFAADKFFVMLFDASKRYNAGAKASGGIVIPEKLKISASKFGRRSRFLIQFRMVACLHDILKQTNLWSPVPGTSYATWSASLDLAGVNSPRGVSGVQSKDGDTIIDLCSGSPSQIAYGKTSGYRKSSTGDVSHKLLCPEVEEGRSYMDYQNRIRGEQESVSIIHSLMQAAGLYQNPSSASSSAFPAPQTGLEDDVVHVSGKSQNYVVMQGRALRLKFKPDVPRLKQVAGVQVEELARNVQTEIATAYFDCPLMETQWAVLYRVKGQLYGLSPANNKQMCFTSGEDDGRK